MRRRAHLRKRLFQIEKIRNTRESLCSHRHRRNRRREKGEGIRAERHVCCYSCKKRRVTVTARDSRADQADQGRLTADPAPCPHRFSVRLPLDTRESLLESLQRRLHSRPVERSFQLFPGIDNYLDSECFQETNFIRHQRLPNG